MTISRLCYWMLPLASVLPGCFGGSLQGNNQPVDGTRAVQGFSDVDSETSLDVLIQQGSEFHVEIHVDANLLPLVTTRIVGNALVIDSTEPIEPHVAGPHVIITMPSLDHAELSGSGDMRIPKFDSGAALALVLSGSGDLAFSGKAPGLTVTLSGSGDVALAGSVDGIVLDLSGSGNVDARPLSASRGNAALSGAGDISASIAGPVDVSLTGSGNIDLYGGATIGHYAKTGSGELKVH